MNVREYKYDNLKGMLIFLVVLCHLFEITSGIYQYRTYLIVYTFHMPLFVFISGLFAGSNLKRIFTKILFPYILFQILYVAILEHSFNLYTPYWHLWYMFSMVVWSMSLKIIKRNYFLYAFIFIVISLFAGYISYISKAFALSRLLFYYPFFLVGYGIKRKGIRVPCNLLTKIIGIVLLLMALYVSKSFIFGNVKTSWLYHSVPYAESGETIWFRLFSYIIAFVWIWGFLFLASNRKIFVLSEMGRYSVAIYLIHPFIIKIFQCVINPFVFYESVNLLLAIVISALICVAFGNRHTYKVLKILFGDFKK